jgi:hypothetical protein
MSHAITFDTLKFVKQLEKGGVEQKAGRSHDPRYE